MVGKVSQLDRPDFYSNIRHYLVYDNTDDFLLHTLNISFSSDRVPVFDSHLSFNANNAAL